MKHLCKCITNVGIISILGLHAQFVSGTTSSYQLILSLSKIELQYIKHNKYLD